MKIGIDLTAKNLTLLTQARDVAKVNPSHDFVFAGHGTCRENMERDKFTKSSPRLDFLNEIWRHLNGK